MADIATKLAQAGTQITFDRVVKAYGAHTVLHGIDLDIAPGEFVALLGPSGCGKTTMLRCLAGLEHVTKGMITVNGTDIISQPASKRDMGVVFQQYSLFPNMTVSQNVEFGLQMRKVAKAERISLVGESLELVGLSHLGDRYAHTLSGGQQQRVALARALVTRPRALLLDEPLSALDAKVRVRLRDEIKAIQTELGITTIFVTHDQEEALAIADRVAVMKDGVIEQLGTPEELYQRPSRLPTVDSSRFIEGDEIAAFIRPEHLSLLRPGSVLESQGGAVEGPPAVVVSSGFLGSQRRTVVRLKGGELITVQHASSEQFSFDDSVQLCFAGNPVAIEAAVVAPE